MVEFDILFQPAFGYTKENTTHDILFWILLAS